MYEKYAQAAKLYISINAGKTMRFNPSLRGRLSLFLDSAANSCLGFCGVLSALRNALPVTSSNSRDFHLLSL